MQATKHKKKLGNDKYCRTVHHGQYKRNTPLKGEGTHITVMQAFCRAWLDYIEANGLNRTEVLCRIERDGRINYYANKFHRWASGQVNPYTYTYAMQVLAEAVGKNMWDFVSVHQPEEKEAVRAVIKNPDLM